MSNTNYIDVILTSWPNHPRRIEYVRKTIEALRKNLRATRHGLRFFCSAETERDPEQPWFSDELIDICRFCDVKLQWREGPADLGANMNAAFQMSDSDYRWYCQDDWLLRVKLDLSEAADWLEAHSDFLIYRHLACRCVCTELDGAAVIDMQKSRHPYGDNPGIWHWPRFVKALGMYEENTRFGRSERRMSEKAVAKNVKLAAHPLYLNPTHGPGNELFKHLGEVSAVVNDWRTRGVSR